MASPVAGQTGVALGLIRSKLKAEVGDCEISKRNEEKLWRFTRGETDPSGTVANFLRRALKGHELPPWDSKQVLVIEYGLAATKQLRLSVDHTALDIGFRRGPLYQPAGSGNALSGPLMALNGRAYRAV